MSNNITNLFNNMGLSEQDISYYKNQYKNIQDEFINKRFNFNRVKTDSQYINVLKEYLKYNGYGYLFKTISYLSSYGKVDSIKLAKMLINTNLIHKSDIKRESTIKNKEIIRYKQEFGLIEKYLIRYRNNEFPFKIENIDYTNKDYIHCEITDSNNITIEINIEKDREVNFTEIIMIYTSYGVDKLEFSIKCDKNVNTLIELKNFSEFIELCKVDYDNAFEIFNKEKFREWLERKRYVTQVINYDQALSIKKTVDNGPFKAFCAFNETYPIKSNEDEEEESVEVTLSDNTESNDNGKDEAITEEAEEKKVEILHGILKLLIMKMKKIKQKLKKWKKKR